METNSVEAQAGTVVTAPDKYRRPAVTAEAPNNELGKDEFLQLLVAQLKYQDPLSPSSSEEFISTTAQFTVVEKLDELTKQGESSALVQSLTTASSLVGREVTANRDGLLVDAVVDHSRIVGGEVVLDSDVGEIRLDQIVSVGAVPMPELAPARPETVAVPPAQPAAAVETAAVEPSEDQAADEVEEVVEVEAAAAVADESDQTPNVVADSEPIAVPEPVVDPEPVVAAVPVADPEPVVAAVPVADTEPVVAPPAVAEPYEEPAIPTVEDTAVDELTIPIEDVVQPNDGLESPEPVVEPAEPSAAEAPSNPLTDPAVVQAIDALSDPAVAQAVALLSDPAIVEAVQLLAQPAIREAMAAVEDDATQNVRALTENRLLSTLTEDDNDNADAATPLVAQPTALDDEVTDPFDPFDPLS